MDAKVPPTEPNSLKSLKKAVVHIGGIPVEFPYQPYGTQMGFMSRVIATLDRAVREGHCHALLESPTGTGKSLSLLCSTLAWQQNQRSKTLLHSHDSKPSSEAVNDPLGHGGGFIHEPDPSGNSVPPPSVSNGKNQKKKEKKMAPTIFYASRTHSQVSQVIREYRKTTYRVPMAVLASRRHYCTNSFLRGNDNIDENCKTLLKDRGGGCTEFKNANKVKGHPSLQKGGCYEAHDIEDLVKIGQAVKGCSYFAACSMAEDAHIVFCPYSYIVNPIVRRAMDVDIKGAIIILDEAHNIEDMARDSGSMDVEEDALLQLQNELGQLSLTDAMTYQPLYEMTQDILSWIAQRKNTLGKHEYQHYFSCWNGDNALKELQEANISLQCFPILQECARKAIRVASEAELGLAHLSGMSTTILEGLFSSLSYFFSGNGAHVYDYQLALQSCVKKSAENVGQGWTCTLSLWCLNPAIVFRDIADLSLSVILTSGTLSPTHSFSTELGVQFATCLEAPHVIDVESQLWAAIISNGPCNYPLNASYKTSEGYAFQDAIGASIEEICNIVPGGVLIFFPSYKLMEKLRNRWSETGQWSRLNFRKSLFVEPRGGSQDEFEPILKGYYNSIQGLGSKPTNGRKRRGSKLDVSKDKTRGNSEDLNKGAAFLAVCRGKVSEGIDFSDENARVVIIVGIPFPNINDIQVAQKKKFNDTYKASRNLLSGSEWYCQQAFRAINQAAGRCIRHQFDYGAIILLDERFCEERNRKYISKWIRKSVRHYGSFDESLDGLKSFFRNVQEKISKDANLLLNLDLKTENIPAQREVLKSKTVKKSNTKLAGNVEPKSAMPTEKSTRLLLSSSPVMKYTFLSTHTKSKSQTSELTYKAANSSTIHIDEQCEMEDDSRYSTAQSMIYLSDDHDVSIVNETPDVNRSFIVASPESFSKNECSSSPDSSGSPKSFSLVKTPRSNVTAETNSLVFEKQSYFNLSVNSISQKRRDPLSSSLVHHLNAELFDSKSTTPDRDSSVMCSISAIGSNHKTKFEYESFDAENDLKKSFTQPVSMSNNNSLYTSNGLFLDKRLQIFCALCRKPLGLPENSSYVPCLLTSSSKHHLVSLWKKISDSTATSTSNVPVLVSDKSLVNQQICNITVTGISVEEIWCKEDGCVFNTIFCPFCSNLANCLGVLVVATDASNIQLLNKIMLYMDHLEIPNLEASNKKDLSPSGCSYVGKSPIKTSIEKFSYSQNENSEGWRTTKSKTGLLKRSMLSTSGQYRYNM